jgi:hypothetical protein
MGSEKTVVHSGLYNANNVVNTGRDSLIQLERTQSSRSTSRLTRVTGWLLLLSWPSSVSGMSGSRVPEWERTTSTRIQAD